MAAGLVVRLIDLGDRPFHHDESQDAYFSWVFFDHGDYHYQPILHGPFRFYLTALMYLLFGDSDFTARLAPALMGTLMIGLAYLLRRQIGNAGALAAAAVLAFCPSYLYFSRFAREDIYIAAINLGLIIAVFRFLERPFKAGPAIILGLTALAFATKETTYITLFVSGTFLIPYAIWEARRGRAGVWAAMRSVGGVAWAYGAAAFALVFTIMFTVFLTNPPGLWDGIHDAIAYWLDQQGVGRGGEPWYFYFAVLFGEEWPILVLGAVGIVGVVRRPTTFGLFCIWAFAGSLAVYSWASEKFAWLVLHPLLPLILLAGIGVQTLWEARPARRTAGLVAMGACAAYLIYASFLVNAVHRADPVEWLVSTQTAEEAADIAHEILRRPSDQITVDVNEGATFPWAWYFRHAKVGYIDMRLPTYQPSGDVLLMTEASQAALASKLGGYEGRKFRFRIWWVREWSKKLDAGAWWRWFTAREPWNPTGGMDEWYYRRSSTGGGGSAGPRPGADGNS
jgi:uncharacterized protein (TIGR03663 family)